MLIYCISKLMHRKNNGEAIGPVVRITTHDLLVSTNRNTGGISYERLEDTLDRLAGTRIKTNVATGEEISTQNFGIIEWYDYNRKASGFVERLKYLDIKLSDWLFRAIDAAEVLPISRDYFRIRRPIDRRIYEIARKHCGKQISWKISTGLLQKKCGSRQAGKHFVAHLRELVASNALPDYDVALDLGFVVFTRAGRQADRAAEAPCPRPGTHLRGGSSPEARHPDFDRGDGTGDGIGPALGQVLSGKDVLRLGGRQGPGAQRGCALLRLGQELHQGPAAAVTPMTQIHTCPCSTLAHSQQNHKWPIAHLRSWVSAYLQVCANAPLCRNVRLGNHGFEQEYK